MHVGNATARERRGRPGALALSLVGVGGLSKRILVGRKLRSSQLGETLLPKRIALPVFASDALSSVAYAPDEVFIMLSVAGASAYVWSWKIGIAVALVMLTVVASYRQNVHAYPSGGGDYEVATVNLGQTAGVTVASALLVDYVLTVAVSISSGVQNAASALPFINGHETEWACVLVLVLAAMNLRGVRESGAWFAVPTYGFMVGVIGMALYAAIRATAGDLPDVESARLHLRRRTRVRRSDRHRGDDLPARAGVLVGLCGADRRRGDLERRAGVPQAEEPQRRDHLAAARRDRGHDAAEHHRAGPPDGDEVRRPQRPRPTP